VSKLERFGLKWNGPKNFVVTEMKNGYWTPWHLADERITKLTATINRLSLELNCADPDGEVSQLSDEELEQMSR